MTIARSPSVFASDHNALEAVFVVHVLLHFPPVLRRGEELTALAPQHDA